MSVFVLQHEVVDKTPPLLLLVQHLYDPNAYQTSQQVIDLLYWVLVHLKDVRMQSVPKSEVSDSGEGT